MAKPQTKNEVVPIGKLFLLPDNPRHERFETEAEAIDYLCDSEDVLPLAKDIAVNGINQLSRIALVPIDDSSSGKSFQSYYVADGNRRICAIKLLRDPELAPTKFKAQFKKLSDEWQAIEKIDGVVFTSYDETKIWLQRIHNGAQGGIGQKNWTTEQQARFDSSNKNKEAQKLLDYAEQENFITPEERRRKITTLQRFIDNESFRKAIGLQPSGDVSPLTTRPKDDFDKQVKLIMRDLVERKVVHSRTDSKDIEEYATALNSLKGLSGKRIEAKAPVKILAKGRKGIANKKPLKLSKPETIEVNNEVTIALRSLGNQKLIHLYHSITSIRLENNTPLLAIGVWALFEILTKCAGANDETAFDAFLNNERLGKYGFSGRHTINAIRTVLSRVRIYGNTTKHHEVSGVFDGEQLFNDMATLRPLTMMLIKEAEAKKK